MLSSFPFLFEEPQVPGARLCWLLALHAAREEQLPGWETAARWWLVTHLTWFPTTGVLPVVHSHGSAEAKPLRKDLRTSKLKAPSFNLMNPGLSTRLPTLGVLTPLTPPPLLQVLWQNEHSLVLSAPSPASEGAAVLCRPWIQTSWGSLPAVLVHPRFE